jgi:lipopolysaccharide transport system ATP-binding protein
MALPIIKIEDLSKQYRLGVIGTGTISHDLKRWWIVNIRRKEDPYLKIGETNEKTIRGNSEYIWALRDINLAVQQGEVMGIIGKNGAGKSTLLKILSRVTSPTTGQIFAKGRIASLLEVGTGFHPEMTGRENIFMNGSIMGMSKIEIRRKLNEIVDFAGVERYIDTPVKRYSSGMMVRLGFAVAAHLEPEILVVDEVLAVGDAEFQKKALGKMQDISSEHGRTVLFVSHNMGSIAQLCQKSILLENGRIVKQGFTDQVINYYLQNSDDNNIGYRNELASNDIGIIEVFTLADNLERNTNFTHKEKIQIVAILKINQWVSGAEFRFAFRDIHHKVIFTSDLSLEKEMIKNDCIEITAEIPSFFLRPGNYSLTFATFVPHQFTIDLLEDIFTITVIDGGSKYAQSEGLDYGYIFFEPTWKINGF